MTFSVLTCISLSDPLLLIGFGGSFFDGVNGRSFLYKGFVGEDAELFSNNCLNCFASDDARYAAIFGSVFSIVVSFDSITADFLCSTIPDSISNLFYLNLFFFFIY